MKLFIKKMMIATMALSAVAANAVVFTDATGDVANPMLGTGNANIDLASLEITNTLTSISFKLTTAGGSITSPDWTKYGILMRGPGTSGSGNGWGRPIDLAGGANRHIAGWVDSGAGMEVRNFAGTWGLIGATYNSTPGMSAVISGNSVTYTANLSTLNYSLGDTFTFDAFSTGGGPDGAWDLLSLATPSSTDWGQAVTSNSNLQYTVVPEPATMTAIAFGAAALFRRRKKA